MLPHGTVRRGAGRLVRAGVGTAPHTGSARPAFCWPAAAPESRAAEQMNRTERKGQDRAAEVENVGIRRTGEVGRLRCSGQDGRNSSGRADSRMVKWLRDTTLDRGITS